MRASISLAVAGKPLQQFFRIGFRYQEPAVHLNSTPPRNDCRFEEPGGSLHLVVVIIPSRLKLHALDVLTFEAVVVPNSPNENRVLHTYNLFDRIQQAQVLFLKKHQR